MPKRKTFRDADFARERLRRAVFDLATSHNKLRERVLDAYSDHLSLVPARPKFFPDHETLDHMTAIRQIVRMATEKIERNPGPYEGLLRSGVMSPLRIARNALDYRVARKLAELITELHFKLQKGLEWEYRDELLKHMPTKTSQEVEAEMSRTLKRIQRQQSGTKRWSATAHLKNGREGSGQRPGQS